jgi:hypothetical protein
MWPPKNSSLPHPNRCNPMPRQILKYSLPADAGEKSLRIPAKGMVLCLAVQRGQPVIYINADPDNPTVEQPLMVCYTGDELPPKTWGYIGTLLVANDNLVLHYFISYPHTLKRPETLVIPKP